MYSPPVGGYLAGGSCKPLANSPPFAATTLTGGTPIPFVNEPSQPCSHTSPRQDREAQKQTAIFPLPSAIYAIMLE